MTLHNYFLYSIPFVIFVAIFYLIFRGETHLQDGFIAGDQKIYKNYGVVEITLFSPPLGAKTMRSSDLYFYGIITTKSYLELTGLETIFDKIETEQTEKGLLITGYKYGTGLGSPEVKTILTKLEYALTDYANKHEEVPASNETTES